MLNNNIVLSKFPTHIAITNNKTAPNKYIKINNQGLYSGNIHHHSRSVAVENIHSYLNAELDKHILFYGKTVVDVPVQLVIRIFTVLNHGDIRRNKDGRYMWKESKDNYEPNWDEDNLRSIWEKCIKDCLTAKGFWKDDIVSICRGIDSLVEFVDDVEDRRIELNFRRL